MVSIGFKRITCIIRCIARTSVVPLAGLEPTHLASEASALSSELQGLGSKLLQRSVGLLRSSHSGLEKNPQLLSPVSHRPGRGRRPSLKCTTFQP